MGATLAITSKDEEPVWRSLNPKSRKVLMEGNIKDGETSGRAATKINQKKDSGRPSTPAGFLPNVAQIAANIMLTALITVMSEDMVEDYWESVKSRHIHNYNNSNLTNNSNSTNNTKSSSNLTKLSSKSSQRPIHPVFSPLRMPPRG